MSKIDSNKLLIAQDRKIIEVQVPKELWDADMSIWNWNRDILDAWMRSVRDIIQQK
jgi:hypothetical protein